MISPLLFFSADGSFSSRSLCRSSSLQGSFFLKKKQRNPTSILRQKTNPAAVEVYKNATPARFLEMSPWSQKSCSAGEEPAGGSTWQRTGHQVSPSRDRRRKSKERGRGDMERGGGGAGPPTPPVFPLLLSSSFLSFPLPLSGFPPLLPSLFFYPPLLLLLCHFGRKWKVKGEQEVGRIHLCVVKKFLCVCVCGVK